MIDWDAASAALESTVAEVFDTQSFRVFPTAKGASVNDTRVPDPSRSGFEFKGSIHFGPAPLLPGFSHPSTLMTDRDRIREAPSHEAVITALSTQWPEPVKVDDQVEWKGARYIIAANPVDGGKRLALFVNRTKVTS